MDGLPRDLTESAIGLYQRTLKSSIDCVGVGLHSGRRVNLALLPADTGTGIVFRRTDLGIDIPARHDAVIDTRLCTVLAAPDAPHARIGTVEHIMAALAACGVDNAIIAVDGPEVPVLDGSAAPFVFLLDCAGIVAQTELRAAIEVHRAVRVSDGDAFVELRPTTGHGLDLAVSIEFDAQAIGRQTCAMRLSEAGFRQGIAHARTFAMAADIAGLQAAGLALGGSLDNAVVVDDHRVLNPGGLRMADEFVRHKMLDLVGDLALAGAALRARVVAHRPGHALNNRVLRALLADRSAWRWASPAMVGWNPALASAAA